MRFIIVDGIDGSGKTTVAGWIAEHYAALGESVHVQGHPSDRLLGKAARSTLQGKGKAMHLLSSGLFILDVLTSVIRLPRWKRKYGTIVFVRYLMSTAYLPDPYAQKAYDLFARVLPVPERMLLVDVEPKNALMRISQRQDREEMFENLPALTEVRERILRLAIGWKMLDNNDGEEEARHRLLDILTAWK